jgi:hypothetical protein
MKTRWIAVPTAVLLLGLVHTTATPAYAAPLPAPGAGIAQGPGWDQPPGEYREIQKKGFHDGVEGARKDAENHRPPSVENRDEYKHPDVPHRDRHDYREAFRHGYQAGVEHLMGDHPHHD